MIDLGTVPAQITELVYRHVHTKLVDGGTGYQLAARAATRAALMAGNAATTAMVTAIQEEGVELPRP